MNPFSTSSSEYWEDKKNHTSKTALRAPFFDILTFFGKHDIIKKINYLITEA